MFGKNAGNFQYSVRPCQVTENAGMETARPKSDAGKPETDTL